MVTNVNYRARPQNIAAHCLPCPGAFRADKYVLGGLRRRDGKAPAQADILRFYDYTNDDIGNVDSLMRTSSFEIGLPFAVKFAVIMLCFSFADSKSVLFSFCGIVYKSLFSVAKY